MNRSGGLITSGLGLPVGKGSFVTMHPFHLFVTEDAPPPVTSGGSGGIANVPVPIKFNEDKKKRTKLYKIRMKMNDLRHDHDYYVWLDPEIDITVSDVYIHKIEVQDLIIEEAKYKIEVLLCG